MKAQDARNKTQENINNSMAPIYKMIDEAVERREYSVDISKFQCDEHQRKILAEDGYVVIPKLFNNCVTISWKEEPSPRTQW